MRILPDLLSALLCGFTDAPPAKPIYRMSPQEAGNYIASVHQAQPGLRKRIAAIGRQNIGQPYALNLLGEFVRAARQSAPRHLEASPKPQNPVEELIINLRVYEQKEAAPLQR